jgi:hypothetical protein
MDIEHELELIRLKNKFMIALKWYLANITDMLYFYRVIDILKEKYNDISDTQVLERIKNELPQLNQTSNSMYNLNGIIYQIQNKHLLLDLIKTIDTGFNYEIS